MDFIGQAIETPALRSRGWLTSIMLAALVGLAVTTTASGQTDSLQSSGNALEPTCASLEQSVNSGLNNESAKGIAGTPPKVEHPCESSYTPIVRRAPESWTQVAGARFPRTHVPGPASKTPSSTPFTLDLHAVSFRNTKQGFFGGAICREAPTRDDYASEEDYLEAVRGCERVPIIYRYTNFDKEGPVLAEAWIAADDDQGGYVGAIASIDDSSALAVGGSGTFPRREMRRGTDTQGQAGMARAWLYRDGTWRELENQPDPAGGFSGKGGDELPDEMRGLGALRLLGSGERLYDPRQTDFESVPSGGNGFAGALGQIWEWREGRFLAPHFSTEFRVTGFAFEPRSVQLTDPADPSKVKKINHPYFDVWATTAGCCSESLATDYGRILKSTTPGHWSEQEAVNWFGRIRPVSISSFSPNGAMIINPDGEQPPQSDPLYPEPPSHVAPFTPGYLGTGSINAQEQFLRNRFNAIAPEVRRFTSDPFRLTSIDDDAQFVIGKNPQNVQTKFNGDGTWSVGGMPNGQAIVQRGLTGRDNGGNMVLETTKTTQPAQLYELPSYRLNAIDVIRSEGILWAVGDHGAIMRFGESAPLASGEPPPPKLGARRPASFSESEPYQATFPLADEIGTLPSLESVAIERLPEPRFQLASEPDVDRSPSAIVISRDGSEGWATTEFGDLYHYTGTIWRRCDPVGQPNKGISPDSACAGIAPKITAATRVPYENDSDPTNDDRFEIVGIEPGLSDKNSNGKNFTGGRKIWRYTKDEWRVETFDGLWPGFGPDSIAFTSPNDGWAVTGYVRKHWSPSGEISGSVRQHPHLFHYDGESWNSCAPTGSFALPDRTSTRTICDDWNDLLPFGSLESAENLGEPRLGVAAAGERVYLWGTRGPPHPNGDPDSAGRQWPMVIHSNRDLPCASSGDPGCWRADEGLDGGCERIQAGACMGSTDGDSEGRLSGFIAAESADGGYEGWLGGYFSNGDDLLRMESGGRFTPWREPHPGPLIDYGVSLLPMHAAVVAGPSGIVTFSQSPIQGPLLSHEGGNVAWQIVPSPPGVSFAESTSVASDMQGGLWYAATDGAQEGLIYRYSNQQPREVFEDAPHPIRQSVNAAVGGADGTLWVATRSNVIYRYQRITGWDRVRVPGWDLGGIQTSSSPIEAVAVGPNGEGIAVGPGGRIATLSREEVALDPAAGTSCALLGAIQPPCGTSRDLVAAAVSPDGSAIAAGKNASLLWRPAGGHFRAIAKPEVSHNATFAAVSMPSPNISYLATSLGQIYRGTRLGDQWSWQIENLDLHGSVITRVNETTVRGLAEIAVGQDGYGYAVSDDGHLYAREPGEESSRAWRAIPIPFSAQTVALSPEQGNEALIAGPGGLIAVARKGGIEMARLSDPAHPTTGRAHDPITRKSELPVARGLAILAGPQQGQVEAWAVFGHHGGRDTVLHLGSEDREPLLNPQARAHALTDVPPPREGELSFATFGKSDCPIRPSEPACLEMLGSNLRHELVARRVREEIAERSSRIGGPLFALFTGDASDGAGTGTIATPIAESINHRRWRELIGEPLLNDGVPLFGAIGGQDLNVTEHAGTPTPGSAQGTRQIGGAGPSVGWRAALASMPAPWGAGDELEHGGVRFEAVSPSDLSHLGEDLSETELSDGVLDGSRERARDGVEEQIPGSLPDSLDNFLPYQNARQTALNSMSFGNDAVPRERSFSGAAFGGARTHYAFDVLSANDEKLSRVIVVDTSLRSLAAADSQQNPPEPRGQAAWLEEVLCFRDDPTADAAGCTRESHQEAIVLSNAPTYTYGPGAAELSTGHFLSPLEADADTQLDGSAFEAILLRHRASVVVSGRIGWNGLYWTTAPGVHEPCPGEPYQTEVPEHGARVCGRAAGDVNLDAVDDIPSEDPQGQGVLPFVISSSAGGKLADGGSGTADEGFWSGYAVVRLSESGNPHETIVEQRPVLDWIGISSPTHVLNAKERGRLTGYARETAGLGAPFRYVEMSSPAITHRFTLLTADPDEPWLPKLERGLETVSEDGQAVTEDFEGCGPYVCLDPKVGRIDDHTGDVQAGNGKYPDTFAIALLSVGDHSATWPLVFKRSPSFVVSAMRGLPTTPTVAANSGSAPQPPQPPNPSQPNVPQASPPSIPVPPSLAPLSTSHPSEPQPPAPPAPPPPSEQPSPLSLSLAPPSITIATPTAVIQPPTPPVNPAPPGGARREARQRQAATQKSGADSAEGQTDVDMAGSSDTVPGSHGMTRHEFSRSRTQRAGPSFSALDHSRDRAPSTLLYTGGVTLLALAAALGWSGIRPTPRRRPGEMPAPAQARISRRK